MDRTTSHAAWADDDGYVTCYMCMIDWECELGGTSHNTIYASEEALKKSHPMWEECGIVEVRVKFSRIVQEGQVDFELAQAVSKGELPVGENE